MSADVNDVKLKYMLAEFDQCFSQMRHYDNSRMAVAQYVFAFYSAIATAAIALNELFFDGNCVHSINFSISLLLFLGFIIGFIVIAILARNRTYYTTVSRQVNSIRNTILEITDESRYKFENFCNFETGEPRVFNSKSTQILMIILLSFINSVFLAFAGFFLLKFFNSPLEFYIIILPILVILSLFLEYMFAKKIFGEGERYARN